FLLDTRLPLGFSLCSLFTRPKENRVVCRCRSGDVNRTHERMIGEKRANVRSAIGKLEIALLDERPKRLLDDRPKRLVHGVHLEDANLIVDDELIEDIHRRDRALIPRAEDDADPALADAPRRLGAIDPALRGLLPRLNEDVAGRPGEK